MPQPHQPAGARPAGTLPAGVSDSGSIVYIKNDNIYLSSPDTSTTIQVTHDGATATTDGTGDIGYASVSQSSAGMIVAVRNQTEPDGDLQGWVWVMDRQGHLINKFKPTQFQLSTLDKCPTAPWSIYPQGVLNIRVSPDGKQIAYLDSAGFISGADCAATFGFRTIVANIDGSNANQLGLDQSIFDIEFGQWASNSQLLLDTTDTGEDLSSYALYYDDLPSTAPTYWTESPDMIDSAYEEPAYSDGLMVTDGYSEYSSAQVMRLWTTSGPGSAATARCEAVVTPSGATASDPNLAPDGSAVVWYESNGPADQSDEGIYLANTAPAKTGDCGDISVSLLIQGGTSPQWGPAAVNQPYFTDITPLSQFYADIMWLGENGVTTGFPDGTYRPGSDVSRGQMAAYLYRLAHNGSDAGHCTGAAPYPDVPASSPFCADISWLKTAGVTTGYPDGTYRPGNNVSRGQMAAYLYRYAHNGSDAGRCTGAAPYPDVPAASPFCADISWLKTAGVTTGYPDGNYRPGNNVSRGQMAAYLHRLAEAAA